MEDYAVVVVFSDNSLKEIFIFIKGYLDVQLSDIGIARIEKYKTKDGMYKESNRTILLVKRCVLDKAIECGLDKPQPGLDNFRITEFKLSDKHFPKENHKANIYLNFPKEINYEDITVQIKDYLEIMKNFGVIKYDYNIKIPLESRERGTHKGIGYINFTKDELVSRSLVRLLLQDLRIYNDRNVNSFCYLKSFWVNDK